MLKNSNNNTQTLKLMYFLFLPQNHEYTPKYGCFVCNSSYRRNDYI